MKVTRERLVALGAVTEIGARDKNGGEPTHDSWKNESSPVLKLQCADIGLVCWADDLSRWWLVAVGDNSGYWFEKYIPAPATMRDVRDLCRLLGIPVAVG